MSPDSTTFNLTLQRIGAGAIFVAVVTGGVLVLLYFWSQLLRPGNLNAFSLPLVAFIAGVAATFNPCGMPALPGFLAFGGGGEMGVRRRAGLGLGASLGAMSLLIALGIIVAALGAGTKDLIAPHFRWVQLGVGLFLVTVAVLHLTGQTSRLPLVGQTMGLGSRVWEGALGNPTPRGSYLFGAGFVLVGVG